MAYIFTAITGSQTVGQAFTRVNQNLAAIETNIPTGTTSGNFLPLSGGTLTGDIVITNSNNLRVQDGSDVNSLELNINSIDFRDDYNAVKTRLQYSPLVNSEAVINMIDTEPDGYMVIVPTPSGEGGKNIRVNASSDGWEYVDLDAKFVINTGDTITGTYTINDGPVDGSVIRMIGDVPLIELSGFTSATLRLIGTDLQAKSTLYPEQIIFDNNQSGGALSSLAIQPQLFDTTGSSILNIIKPTGNTNGFFATVGDISTRPNEFIRVNANGNAFEFGILSGAGTVSVITTVNGWTISGASTSGPSSGGFSAATSVGNGLSVISSATNNELKLFTLSGTNGLVVSTAATGLMTFRGPNTANRVFITDASGNMVNSDFLFTDDTNDTLGIGIAAATTATLLLPVQTATKTPLRFTKTATEYTGAVDGSIWYSSSGNTLKFQKNTTASDFIFKDNNISFTGTTAGRVLIADTNGTISTGRDVVNFGVFNMLTSTTITNTTSETSILNTGATVFYGTNVLAASTAATAMLVAGKKFRFTANGTIATHSSAGDLTARLKLGSLVVASISGFSLHDNISAPNNFYIDSTFTIRTQGALGTVIGGGSLETDHVLLRTNPNGNSFVGLNNLGSLTIDTTTDKLFDFTFQFGTASANNIITINEATLEYLN